MNILFINYLIFDEPGADDSFYVVRFQVSSSNSSIRIAKSMKGVISMKCVQIRWDVIVIFYLPNE